MEKQGKKHVSARNDVSDMGIDYKEASILDLDPAIQRFLDGKNLAARWINGTKYTKAGGFNKDGWQPLKVADIPKEALQTMSLGFGTSGDGYLVRNDLLLAVRPKERQEAHKQMLARRANAQAGREQANAAALREHIGRTGKVFEGYDENE